MRLWPKPIAVNSCVNLMTLALPLMMPLQLLVLLVIFLVRPPLPHQSLLMMMMMMLMAISLAFMLSKPARGGQAPGCMLGVYHLHILQTCLTLQVSLLWPSVAY